MHKKVLSPNKAIIEQTTDLKLQTTMKCLNFAVKFLKTLTNITHGAFLSP